MDTFKEWDRRLSFPGREGCIKNHTKRTRGKKLVSRPPLVVMRPVAPYIALYRIARQINDCIPTLSAPAA